jgi:ABC-type transport system involved in multi-copper enzyme maturation permease subunit
MPSQMPSARPSELPGASSSAPRALGFPRWMRQVRAMLGLELRKTFLRPRALPVVLVALLPVLLLAVRVLATKFEALPVQQAGDVAQTYGVIFQLFYLRLVVFFGCFGIFTYLVRGEMLERSLHFYFLAPLRRDVFMVGKYIAGVVAGGALFTLSVVLQLGLSFLSPMTEGGRAYLLGGPGGGHAIAYLGVTLLAVVGYGAVFLALGMLVKNPMIPAALFLGWEWLNFLLPPALKKISVIHYLQSLCPVPVPHGPFALPAEPTPPVLAVLGLMLFAAVLLFFASRRARRLEILYSTD